MKHLLVALILLMALASAARAGEQPNVYGPGGPAPAMHEAAQAFDAAHQVTVKVTAGPTPQWANKAKGGADVIFSGAEHMMSDFSRTLPGLFDLREAQPLYLRPTAILVRPGNPKGIHGFRDLLAPGVKVITVAGAGRCLSSWLSASWHGSSLLAQFITSPARVN